MPETRDTIIARYRLSLVEEAETPYLLSGADPTSTPEAAAIFMGRILDDRPQETILALYLDTRNRPLGWTVSSVGSVNRAVADPRSIYQAALLINAVGVVVGHQHPSGNPSPSAEDIGFSKRLAAAGELIGVHLVDSIILAPPGRYASLRERGAL